MFSAFTPTRLPLVTTGRRRVRTPKLLRRDSLEVGRCWEHLSLLVAGMEEMSNPVSRLKVDGDETKLLDFCDAFMCRRMNEVC